MIRGQLREKALKIGPERRFFAIKGRNAAPFYRKRDVDMAELSDKERRKEAKAAIEKAEGVRHGLGRIATSYYAALLCHGDRDLEELAVPLFIESVEKLTNPVVRNYQFCQAEVSAAPDSLLKKEAGRKIREYEKQYPVVPQKATFRTGSDTPQI